MRSREQGNMKIALLGWGSLIWDQCPEFDEWQDDWRDDGPTLNLEFSRISESRKDALTLVIDDDNGNVCVVSYAMSKRTDPDDAICDLRSREGTILKRIGYYFIDGSRSGTPEVPETIKDWVKKKKFDFVIWTGLLSNFENEKHEPFSVKAAIAHIKSLPPDAKAEAANYVQRAPEFIDTPLRRALQYEPWFHTAPPS